MLVISLKELQKLGFTKMTFWGDSKAEIPGILERSKRTELWNNKMDGIDKNEIYITNGIFAYTEDNKIEHPKLLVCIHNNMMHFVYTNDIEKCDWSCESNIKNYKTSNGPFWLFSIGKNIESDEEIFNLTITKIIEKYGN